MRGAAAAVAGGSLAWLDRSTNPVVFAVDPTDRPTIDALTGWLRTVNVPGARLVEQRRPRLSGALNDALETITTRYVHWCGADDQAYWWRYPEVARSLPQRGAPPVWIVGRCDTARPNGSPTGAGVYRHVMHRTAPWLLPFTNVIGCPAVLFSAEAARAAGGFDEDVPAAMDYDLWVKLFKRERPTMVPYALGKFTVTDDSLTRAHRRASLEDCYRARRRYFRRAWPADLARGLQAVQFKLQDLLGE